MLVIRAIEPWKLYSVGFSGARRFTLADALLGIETGLKFCDSIYTAKFHFG